MFRQEIYIPQGITVKSILMDISRRTNKLSEPKSPRLGSPTRSQRERSMAMDIKGSSVKITSGPYKGYTGEVKTSCASTAMVELHSGKFVMFGRSQISQIEEPTQIGSFFSYAPNAFSTYSYVATDNSNRYRSSLADDGSLTPMFGPQTPVDEWDT